MSNGEAFADERGDVRTYPSFPRGKRGAEESYGDYSASVEVGSSTYVTDSVVLQFIGGCYWTSTKALRASLMFAHILVNSPIEFC
jgi:hypothetical protein